MILFMLYLIMCLATACVAAYYTFIDGEPMNWIAGATCLAFILAPLVWLMGICHGVGEFFDYCDVRRGVRVPKTNRLEYDEGWWDKYLDANFKAVCLRDENRGCRRIEQMKPWAVF